MSLKLDNIQTLEDFHSKIMDKECPLQKPERDLITKLINNRTPSTACVFVFWGFFLRTASVKSFKDTLQQAELGEVCGSRTITTPRTPIAAAALGRTK